MNKEEIGFTSNEFEYCGKKYDCDFAIKKDIKLIIKEARESHNGVFEKLYKVKSLRPNKIKIYFDDNRTPIYGMIIYLIDYQNAINSRLACGNYYPFHKYKDEDIYRMEPHPYQASICW